MKFAFSSGFSPDFSPQTLSFRRRGRDGWSGKSPLLLSVFLFFALLLSACSGGAEVGGERTPPPEPNLAAVQPARTPDPQANVPPLQLPDAGPVRPGCGDYRLLVTLESDASDAGVRVSGPANAVDVVWSLSGPGLAYSDSPTLPRVVNDDNRDLFGLEGNDGHERLTARFVLLVTGVQAGQRLELEMGHESPGEAGTRITVANAPERMEVPGQELASFQVTQEYQTASVDLCAAEPMPAPQEAAALPPRLLAFYYPWWSTTAEPKPPYRCGGDSFGWLREVDGRLTLVTGHTPIAQDGDRVIYQETACWQEVADERGRTGTIYDVQESHFLAEQMQTAKAYGLDGFAVSVHGDNPQEMQFLQDKALPVAREIGFSVTPLYEAPETGWSYDDQADMEKVGEHLRTLVEMMAGQPATLTVTGKDGVEKVVLFVDPATLIRFPSPEAWTTIRSVVDQAGTPYFLWSGPGAFSWLFLSGFDGAYNDLEVIETLEAPLGLPPYALRDERRLAYRATAWAARERDMPLALPVVLGWEGAEALRSEEDVSLSRDYGAPGDYGKYYRVRWEDALEQSPDWVVITSWNEWAEGTELEPSDTYPPSRFDYLQATWQYACRWRGGDGCTP